MKLKNILIFVFLGTLWVVIGYYYAIYNNKQQTISYMNSSEVFDGFVLKKQLEQQLMNVRNNDKKKMDSLGVLITGHIQKYDQNPDKALGETIVKEKELYEQMRVTMNNDLEEQTKSFDKQIWTQIEQYTKEYALSHHIHLILTKHDNGDLIYADPENDITKDFLIFLNQHFQNK